MNYPTEIIKSWIEIEFFCPISVRVEFLENLKIWISLQVDIFSVISGLTLV